MGSRYLGGIADNRTRDSTPQYGGSGHAPEMRVYAEYAGWRWGRKRGIHVNGLGRGSQRLGRGEKLFGADPLRNHPLTD
jgi:hypothetical protein